MNSQRRSTPALDALLDLTVFRSCTASDLAPLLPDTDVLTVPDSTVIDRRDATARQFVGIVSGYVRAFDGNGRLHVLGPGDQIGADELLDDELHSATYTSTTTATLVVVFGPAFRAVARTLPGVTDRVLSTPRIEPVVGAPRLAS